MPGSYFVIVKASSNVYSMGTAACVAAGFAGQASIDSAALNTEIGDALLEVGACNPPAIPASQRHPAG